MWLPRVLNSFSSQAWAFVLIVLGMMGFGIACFCHTQDVRSTIMNSSTGLVVGGVAMFQHQTKGPEDGTTDPDAKSATLVQTTTVSTPNPSA